MAEAKVEVLLIAKDQMSGTLSKAKEALGGLSTVGKAAIAGVAGLSAAAAGAGLALGKLATDAAVVEGIRDAFRGVAESAGVSADEMLAALEQSSAGMVSQRDLMMSFNKAAQLVSKDFAKQLPEAMQYLAKVASATGEDMSFLLNSLVVGVGRLSPMILDNLGIQVKLSEATERAAQMFGVQADQLTKAQLQAGMMNVVLEKLQENTAAMPDVAGSAGAAWAQLGAMWQNLKDQLGMALLPAFNTLLQSVIGLAQTALPPLITAFEARVVPMFQAAAQAIGTFIAALQGGMGPLEALRAALSALGLEGLVAQFDAVRAAVSGLVATVGPYVAQVVSWIRQHVQLRDVLAALGVAIASVVVPAVVSLIAAVAPVIATFAAVTAAVAALRTAWESNFLGIQERTQAVMSFLQNLITTVLTAVQNFWQTHHTTLQNVAATVWQAIQITITTILNALQQVITAVLTAVQGFWQQHGSAIQQTAQLVWQAIQQLITTALGAIQGVVQAVTSAIGAFWQQHHTTLLEIAQNIWTTIQTLIGAQVNIILSVVRTVLALLRGDWSGAFNELRNIAQTVLNAITTVVQTWGPTVVGIVRGIVTFILDAFRNVDWGGVGRAIVDGIAAGIRAGAGAIINAARSAARAALDAAKRALGIGSPSVVFEMQVGQPVAEGVARGILGGLDQVHAALGELLKPPPIGELAPVPVMPAAAAVARRPAVGGITININGNIIGTDRQIVDAVSDEIGKQLRRMGVMA